MSEDVLQPTDHHIYHTLSTSDNWTTYLNNGGLGSSSNHSIHLADNNTTSTTTTASGAAAAFDYNSAIHIQELALAGLLSIVIIVTVVGNTLVITAVLTTRRLRTVTNCFVMSLAVADWLVGVSVMPPAVAYRLMGVWELGWLFCDIWISLDILLCTASILSLCAISVDRYLAVTQPLSYSRKRRSKRLALIMIMIVWLSSALITCPPMFGWYEQSRHDAKTCIYNKNTGYVIFSAMGSFFIPMVVMLYVYMRISCVVAQRHDQLAHIEDRARRSTKLVLTAGKDGESDLERGSSECEEQIRCASAASEQQLHQAPQSEHRKNGGVPASGGAARPSTTATRSYSFKADHHHVGAPPQRTSSLYCTTNLSTRKNADGSNNLDVPMIHFEHTSSHRVSSFRRETKTAQTLSIVVGGFIACWLPFFIYYLLTPFLPSEEDASLIMAYLTWLGWINSAINPFIYAFYSPDFRIAFWRLTFKHFQKNRRADVGFQHH